MMHHASTASKYNLADRRNDPTKSAGVVICCLSNCDLFAFAVMASKRRSVALISRPCVAGPSSALHPHAVPRPPLHRSVRPRALPLYPAPRSVRVQARHLHPSGYDRDAKKPQDGPSDADSFAGACLGSPLEVTHQTR